MEDKDVIQRFKRKRYWQIGEISRLLGVETYTLRYWEENIPELKPLRIRDRRLYGLDHIQLILKLRNMISNEGYTLKGAHQRLYSECSKDKFASIIERLESVLSVFEDHGGVEVYV